MPPIPGVERAIPFRTLDDCERIMEAADQAREAVVVGGGLLGIEAARGLAGRGLPVTRCCTWPGTSWSASSTSRRARCSARRSPGSASRSAPASAPSRCRRTASGWRAAS